MKSDYNVSSSKAFVGNYAGFFLSLSLCCLPMHSYRVDRVRRTLPCNLRNWTLPPFSFGVKCVTAHNARNIPNHNAARQSQTGLEIVSTEAKNTNLALSINPYLFNPKY